MDEPIDGPPVIGLPERVDRRMRLGPFASSRDALKFVTYAATGALLAPFASPWVWLPVVVGGFALSAWRPDGQAIDEKAFTLLAWKLRCWNPQKPGGRVTRAPLVRQGLLQLPSGGYAAVLRTGGTPVAYLPPEELARRFELYRELIRSIDSGFVWLATAVPMRSQAVRPGPPSGRPEERAACSGYSELVALLCRRRLLRRIYFVLGVHDATPDAISGLEGRVAHLIEGLGTLGLRPIRLRDQSLAEAARRFGWPVEVART
jgi:hypothetical protein